MATSTRLYEACLILAIRNWKLHEAPFGIAGGTDFGAAYIGRFDDYPRLVRGHLGTGPPEDQIWPDLDAVKGAANLTVDTFDAELQISLDAAIEQIGIDTAGPGVA